MYDIWFARNSGGFLYYALAKPGEPPLSASLPRSAMPVKNVRQAYMRLRARGVKIAQVGIADAGMLGLI